MNAPKRIAKTVEHKLTKFDGASIKEALASLTQDNPPNISFSTCTVVFEEEIWSFEDLEEFLKFYSRNDVVEAGLRVDVSRENRKDAYVSIDFNNGASTVKIQSDSESDILVAESIFKKHKHRCQISNVDAESVLRKNLVIFIGHGRSPIWRDLKDHLSDSHKFKIEAYEVGSRAGISISEILSSMQKKSSLALIVMTAENEDSEGQLHARENVIHEAGLFQGHLGFKRAIILLENGCKTFSNIDGIQYIPFSKGNIKETFGAVLAVISREFLSRDDLR